MLRRTNSLRKGCVLGIFGRSSHVVPNIGIRCLLMWTHPFFTPAVEFGLGAAVLVAQVEGWDFNCRCSLLCLSGVTMCTVTYRIPSKCVQSLERAVIESYTCTFHEVTAMVSTWKAKPSPRDFHHANPSSSLCFFKTKGLFTCLGREEDPSTRKILEGGSSLRHMFSVHVFGLHAKGCSCPQR